MEMSKRAPEWGVLAWPEAPAVAGGEAAPAPLDAPARPAEGASAKPGAQPRLPGDELSSLFDAHVHHVGEWGAGAKHKFIASGFSHKSNEEVMQAIQQCPNGYFSLGLGPQEIQREELYPDLNAAISEVEKQADFAIANPALAKKFVAIGEVGLDSHWGKTPTHRERQFLAFEKMIASAGRHSLPLIIHSRDAEGNCIRQLLASGAKRVLMHCFGGNLQQARQCVDAGWLISIPPQANSERKKIIRALDLSSLVVESDAPYIGKTHTSALESAKLIARYKEIEVKDVLAATKENALNLFRIKE